MAPPTLVAVLRSRPIGYRLLLPYSSLEEAATYMRAHRLDKVDEKHFPSHALIQWIVA